MKDITKKYSNGEVTIVWQPSLCIHSRICWDKLNGLPQVFNPKERPWIKPEAGTTQQIIDQVKKCPSGALSYFMNGEENTPGEDGHSQECVIEPSTNGPLLVRGNIIIKDKNGNHVQKTNVTAFCRCGASSNKPYCDGTHRKINFQG